MKPRRRRAGFSLVELLVAMVIGTVITGSLVGLFVRQMEFYRYDDALRDARGTGRAALNVMLSDLRMVERLGGVAEAESRDVTLRVPYLWGIVCSSTAGATEVAFFPADSVTVATAGFSGWASRAAATGNWVYIDAESTIEESDAAPCTGSSVAVLSGGSTMTITPGGGTLPVGTPVMLYQEIRYRFAPSTTVVGRDGLYRTVVETGSEDELVAPFSGSARFRFHLTPWEAEDDPPGDLSTIIGLEIHLDSESMGPSPTTNAPHAVSLVTSVFFLNAEG